MSSLDENAKAEDEAKQFEEQIRGLDVAQLVLSTASTIAMLAFTKLDTGELEQARIGIDALQALLPVIQGHVDEDVRRDLQQAVTNLQLAYADAVGG